MLIDHLWKSQLHRRSLGLFIFPREVVPQLTSLLGCAECPAPLLMPRTCARGIKSVFIRGPSANKCDDGGVPLDEAIDPTRGVSMGVEIDWLARKGAIDGSDW